MQARRFALRRGIKICLSLTFSQSTHADEFPFFSRRRVSLPSALRASRTAVRHTLRETLPSSVVRRAWCRALPSGHSNIRPHVVEVRHNRRSSGHVVISSGVALGVPFSAAPPSFSAPSLARDLLVPGQVACRRHPDPLFLVVIAVAAIGHDPARPKLGHDCMVLTHHRTEAVVIPESE